jgi:hypothetical protein
MDCQLVTMVETGRPLSPLERAVVRTRSWARFWSRRLAKAARHPTSVPARIRERLASRRPVMAAAPAARHPLDLQPGDLVRVRPADEIRATLDATGRFEGLDYMAWVMDAFCGRTFTVRKRIDRFFDERGRKMLKLRHVVILDGVYCEPDPRGTGPLAGCTKTCFLFWKEAWLERMP